MISEFAPLIKTGGGRVGLGDLLDDMIGMALRDGA